MTPLARTRAVLRAALVAMCALGSTAAAESVRVSTTCPAIADEQALARALALELAGTTWAVTREATADLVIELAAEPCSADAPIRLAASRDLGTTALELPTIARVRTLALVLAELIVGAPQYGATNGATVNTSQPGATASALQPTATRPNAGALDSLPRGQSLEVADRSPARGPSLEVALALVAWHYDHASWTSLGGRVELARPISWLVARVDLGGDRMTTPYRYDVTAARLGAALLARISPLDRLALEAGVRGELLAGRVYPDTTLRFQREWIASGDIGIVAGAAVAITDRVRLRGSVARMHNLASSELLGSSDDVSAPPVAQDALRSSTTFALTLDVR